MTHRGHGTPSNRRIPEKVKATVLKLYAQRYGDFGPTLAAEKLAERHGVTISVETVRGWFRDAGIDHFTRREAPAPGVAGAQGACGDTPSAGWLAP
jgi:transposase-like protein